MPGVGFSGKDGTIKIGTTDVSEIRGWKFMPKSNNPQYASNNTAGYKRTVAGVKSATGSANGAYDTSATTFLAVLDVGTAATLKLYVDTTHYFTVASVVDDASINVDVDNGEIVSWDLNFTANGSWTNPTAPLVMDPQMFGRAAGKGDEESDPAVAGQSGEPEQATSLLDPKTREEVARIAAEAAVAALMAMGFGKPAQNSEPVAAVEPAEELPAEVPAA